MRVCIVIEHRFYRCSDGSVWTQASYPYSLWARYLSVFEYVTVVTRIKDVPSVPQDWKRVDGEGVSCFGIPYFHGPWEYLRKYLVVKKAALNAVPDDCAVVVRVPSQQISSHVIGHLIKKDHPYAVQAVADPYEVYAPRAFRHPIGRYLRWKYTKDMRRQIANACTVTYVTEKTLQMRYPASQNAFTTYFSDVELPDEAFVKAPRVYEKDGKPIRFICIGAINNQNKGFDILIQALCSCIQTGINACLSIVGDGTCRGELENQVKTLNLQDKVRFMGQVSPGPAIRKLLDDGDVFVMPSRTEGLPRALVEAMARGLPCIGTEVGGIPELMRPEDMVPPDNVAALSRLMVNVSTNTCRRNEMSIYSLKKAQQFHKRILDERMNDFLLDLRTKTLMWSKRS